MNTRAIPLPAREAYRLWVDTYDAENPITVLEQHAVRMLTPPLAGGWLLDAGCGTGRRLPRTGGRGPRRVVGVDLVFEMLRHARTRSSRSAGAGSPRNADPGPQPEVASTSPATSTARRAHPVPALALADVQALPCRDHVFHVVWCRLVIGHLPNLPSVYAELARVARRAGHVIVTDFHPAAVEAGHLRSFRDARGELHVVEHHVHDAAAHVQAAARAGLKVAGRIEPRVSRAVRPLYAAADRIDAYERQRGLPLVLALAFRA